MIARLGADAVVLVHFAFIVFVIAGASFALRSPRWAALHLPAAAWGAYAELTATVCPLTPLENALRQRAGMSGYSGGFVEHYLVPIVYPAGLTATHQRWIGVAVIVVNAVLYAWVWWRWRRRRVGSGEWA